MYKICYNDMKLEDIYKAIQNNDVLLIKKILQTLDISITEFRNESYGTLLHMAAETGGPEMCKYFLDAGCSVEETDLGFGTPLVRVSENWKEEARIGNIKLLLAAGADPNVITENKPVLHHFLENNYRKCAELLIAHKADVNGQEEYHGYTMLHISAARKNYDNILFLLKHGADPGIKSYDNKSILQCAIKSLKSPVKYNYIPPINILSQLLVHGADANAKLDSKTKVFYKILQYASFEIVCLFLRHGAHYGTFKKGKIIRTYAKKNKDSRVLYLILRLQSVNSDSIKIKNNKVIKLIATFNNSTESIQYRNN